MCVTNWLPRGNDSRAHAFDGNANIQANGQTTFYTHGDGTHVDTVASLHLSEHTNHLPTYSIDMMPLGPAGSAVENGRRNFSILWEGLQPAKKPANDNNNNHQKGVEHDDTLDRTQMIIREAKRAAVAWVVVYGILFLGLLTYRWQTRAYYQAEYERKLAALEKITSMTTTTKNTTETPDIEPWWNQQEERVEEAIRDIQDLKKSQEEKLMKVKQQLAAAQTLSEELSAMDFSVEFNQKTARSIDSLTHVLERPSLAELSNTDVLEQLFTQAVEDLTAMAASADYVEWKSLQSYFSTDFPERLPSTQSVIHVEEMAPPSVPAEAARMSELEGHVKAVYDVLDKRSKLVAGANLPEALLPETRARLEQLTRQGIDEALDGIVSTLLSAKPVLDDFSTDSCLGDEEVVEIVEEGLSALQTRADLRNALRKKVMEMDPSATSIILDADLPPPMPKIPVHKTLNLRRVLETPLLMKLAPGIDRIVEMAGGYNDQLDQWLDSIAVSRESIGEVVVRLILEKSGEVEIPTLDAAKSRLPPHAQELLNKAHNVIFSS